MKALIAGIAAACVATAALAQDVAPAPGMSPVILGATNNFGHTTTPSTVNFALIAIGGTTLTVSGLADPKSSAVPPVGAFCSFVPSTATPFPIGILIRCTITAAGVATVTAWPLGGIALGAQALTGNVFWWW